MKMMYQELVVVKARTKILYSSLVSYVVSGTGVGYSYSTVQYTVPVLVLGIVAGTGTGTGTIPIHYTIE